MAVIIRPIERRQWLQIPAGFDFVSSIPFPMSESDFDLLIDTLNLWKPKLVKSPPQGINGPALPKNEPFVRGAPED